MFMCLWLCVWVEIPKEARRGSPGARGCELMNTVLELASGPLEEQQVMNMALGTGVWSSGRRAASALHFGVLSPSLFCFVLFSFSRQDLMQLRLVLNSLGDLE